MLAATSAKYIFYADDRAVISPSIKGLQILLNACAEYCQEWDIKLNAKKTKNMFFGKGPAPNCQIVLYGCKVVWESTCVYLGITLRSAKDLNAVQKTL